MGEELPPGLSPPGLAPAVSFPPGQSWLPACRKNSPARPFCEWSCPRASARGGQHLKLAGLRADGVSLPQQCQCFRAPVRKAAQACPGRPPPKSGPQHGPGESPTRLSLWRDGFLPRYPMWTPSSLGDTLLREFLLQLGLVMPCLPWDSAREKAATRCSSFSLAQNCEPKQTSFLSNSPLFNIWCLGRPVGCCPGCEQTPAWFVRKALGVAGLKSTKGCCHTVLPR